mmetsp:Transcript_33920/g.85062  ORF Transcript_33920/g.85062 Transcript_33920/m.85062 type:complete len:319 (+) Transcript_33920:351-1307(+)
MPRLLLALVQPRAVPLLNAEEHGAQLRQPLGVHRCHALHVLLAGHHQLVVADVVRRVAQAVQRAAGVQVARHAGAAVGVLADALHLGGLVEVRGADGLAHDVPVGAARGERNLLAGQDVNHLGPHLLGLAQPLGVQEVVRAPLRAVVVGLPLLVHVEQREVVRLGHEKLLSRRVALLRAVRRPEKHAGHAEHADDGDHLAGAAKLAANQQHLGQRRVKRELHHLAAHGCERASVVQSGEDPELVHGVEDVVLRGRVHEVKLQQVLHVEALQQQHDIAQVGALDLRHRRQQHLVAEGALREKAVAGARAARPECWFAAA